MKRRKATKQFHFLFCVCWYLHIFSKTVSPQTQITVMKRKEELKGRGSSNYSSFKKEMKETIDAAALQNNMAQKYSLPGSKLKIQVKDLFLSLLFDLTY